MATETTFSKLDELVLRWEDLERQGEAPGLETLCSDCPELAEEVGRRIGALRALDDVIGGDQPSEDRTETLELRRGIEAGRQGRGSARSSAAFEDLRFFAEGGLGEVFLARHVELDREVALKFLKAYRAGDADNRRRFLREAEITGRLEHPGIVPVYALGVDEVGHPCYAMRFIRGETLAKAIADFHAAEANDPGRDPADRSLALWDMLRRFTSTCQTIAYAHSRGMVHRDLKPSNIMLGPFGETLVVDWGLARPFGPRSEPEGQAVSSGDPEMAMTDGVVGTPQYMSPEQAEGRNDEVGPASDVYSLGATLYVLLTGKHPIAASRFVEVVEKIKRGDFLPPRQVNPAVHPALDAVCRKAMSTRPEARYSSAQDLARDVDRWVADEPVSAWREPLARRAYRWARRHRTAVAGAFAVLLTSVIALAVSTLLIGRQKQETDAQRRRADLVNHFLIEDLLAQASPENNPRDRKVTVEELLDRASRSIGRAFPGLPRAEADAREVLGDTYWKLGEYEKAEPHLRGGFRLYREALGPEAPETLKAMGHLVALLADHRKLDEAEALCRAELEIDGRVHGVDHVRTLVAENNLASILESRGKFAEAEGIFRSALERSIRTRGAEDPGTLTTSNNLANVLRSERKFGEAEPLFRRTLEADRRVRGEDHPGTIATMNNLANLLGETGRDDEAEALLRRGLDASRRVKGKDHPTTLSTQNSLAYVLFSRRKGLDEAEVLLRDCLAGRERILGPDHVDTLATVHNLARTLEAGRKPDESEAAYRRCLEANRRVVGPEAPETLAVQGNLGNLLQARGKTPEAEAMLRDCLAAHGRVSKPEDDGPLSVANTLGILLVGRRRFDDAEPIFRKNLEILLQTRGMSHPWTAGTLQQLGGILHSTGRAAESVPFFRQALQARRQSLPSDHPDLAISLAALGRSLAEVGESREAEPLLRDALAIRAKALPPGSWQVANSKSLLGGCLAGLRRFEEAEALVIEGYRGLAEARGIPPELAAQALARVVGLYEAWGRPDRAAEWSAGKASIPANSAPPSPK